LQRITKELFLFLEKINQSEKTLMQKFGTARNRTRAFCTEATNAGPYPEKISVGVIDFSVGVKAFKLSILSPENY